MGSDSIIKGTDLFYCSDVTNLNKRSKGDSAETQVWQAFKAEQPELFTYTETNRTLDALYKHEQGVAIANNGAQLAGTVAGLGLCETTGIGCVLGVPLAGVSYASALQANNNLKSIYDGHYAYSNSALSLASFNPDNFPYIQEEVIPGTVGNWAATSTQTIPNKGDRFILLLIKFSLSG